MDDKYIRFNELPFKYGDTPDGYSPIEAYAKGHEVAVPIVNIPDGLEHLHNCDWEGCGSTSHVVRFSVDGKYDDDSRINKLSSENERLKALLSKIVESIPEDNEWWCPQCGTTGCTFEYRCDQCGQPIGDCQPEVEWLEEANKLLGKSE